MDIVEAVQNKICSYFDKVNSMPNTLLVGSKQFGEIEAEFLSICNYRHKEDDFCILMGLVVIRVLAEDYLAVAYVG